MYAINEVVVKGDKSRTIHLSLDVNGKHIQNFSGDGMIISTPTGSTAYNYAAGGSIVDPGLNLMQLTPLYPINTNAYRCFTSSIIFSSESIIKIIPEYRFEDSILIVIDGVEYRFNHMSNIEVSISDLKIKLLRMLDYDFGVEFQKNFYNILEEIHMKIGVMSDTHGSLTYFEKALDVLSDCDGFNPRWRYTLSWS